MAILDYAIVDAHTHIHPSASEGKAFLKTINFDVPWNGSVDEADGFMAEAGITTSMIVPWMPAKRILEQRLAEASQRGDPDREALLRQQLAEEWSRLNGWASETARGSSGRFLSLVGLDPVLFGAEWARSQVAIHLKAGACGLKITPSLIGAYPSDDRMEVVWQEADRRRLPVLSLATGGGEPAYGHPRHFEDVLRAYPHCKIVFAHMGMGAEEEAARLCNRYANLYCDTSLWISRLGEPGFPTVPQAAELFRRLGTDRVLFGTNYPLCDPVRSVQVLREMRLKDEEYRAICSENFRRVYGEGRP